MNRQIEFIIKQLNSGTVSPISIKQSKMDVLTKMRNIFTPCIELPFIKLYNYVNFGKECRSFNNIVNFKVCRNQETGC